jgi:hypothetical protein
VVGVSFCVLEATLGRPNRKTDDRSCTLPQAVTIAPGPIMRPRALMCAAIGPKRSEPPLITVSMSPTTTSSFLALDMATFTRLASFKNPIKPGSLLLTSERMTTSRS